MEAISSAFGAANRQEHVVGNLLASLKNGSFSTESIEEPKHLLSNSLNELSRSVGQLLPLIQRLPPSNRFHWKAKVDSLQEKVDLHRSEFMRFLSSHHEAAVREQLFSRPEGGLVNRPPMSVEHRFAEEKQALNRFDEHIEIALGQATETLHEMRRQRYTLKGTRTVLLSVMGQLGLSNTVMRFVRRRNREDRLLVYAGMIITTLIIIGLLYLFRW
uniref:Golgi SNAP receptor complex member 2 n=1 Tax=Spongospora subterranea TaxID=70186 RepID=A0A0H5R627_9EUKA|eukprot:CRZ09583.1 hypothetical protein [Spongospora subterranea]